MAPTLTFKALESVGLGIWLHPPPFHWAHSYSDHHPISLCLLPPILSRLLAGVILPGLPLPLCKFGWLWMLLPLCPHQWPHSQGLPGALEGPLACLIWVRVAINLEISWLSSAIPSPRSVVTAALTLTFHWSPHFCFLPSGWHLLVVKRGTRGTVQVPDRIKDVFADHMKEQSLRCCCASTAIIHLGHWSCIWLGTLPTS